MNDYDKMRRKKIFLTILLDVIIFAAALLTFAYFHHVRPSRGEAIKSTIATPSPTAEAPLTPTPSLEPEETPTPTPTPTPAPGDFSAVFPTEDTGVDADYSYQSENVRVAVDKVQENEVTYFVADVWVKNIENLRSAFAKGEYGTGITAWPADMAEENNAIVAISGDYYGARQRSVVIRNGVLYREEMLDDICVLYYDGRMETYTKEEFDLEEAIGQSVWQAWSFGPSLLGENGEALEEFDSSIFVRNPRCAIGYYEPGHYCLVTVDGRQGSYSRGMTLADLSSLFASLGCKVAYNLDGGATAAMVYEGEVISQPSGGGRRSSDIIYVGEEY